MKLHFIFRVVASSIGSISTSVIVSFNPSSVNIWLCFMVFSALMYNSELRTFLA